MTFKTKDFNSLLGTKGFSDQLLKNHFTLYNGYVTNTNKVMDILKQMAEDGKTSSPEFAELKRRFGWEFNGMRLHELYFDNMTKDSQELKDNSLSDQISKDFGSFDKWEKLFKSMGALRGIGWVVLCFDKESKKLFNVWINEHDLGYLAGTTPLLVMDVFEHAFMLDYGLKRADYIDAFFKAINWEIVGKRYG